MKILIYKRNSLINSSGGAEKVMCAMANHLSQSGHQVLFLTRDMRQGEPFYPLDANVKFCQNSCSFSKIRHGIGKLFQSLGLGKQAPFFNRDLYIAHENSKIIQKFSPDIIIATSFIDAHEILYQQKNLPPVVVTVHSTPTYFFKNKKKQPLYASILKNVAAVQVLLPSYVEKLRPYYDGRIEVIGNCISPLGKTAKKQSKRIICLARVEPNKQQKEAVLAFCQIAKDCPDWKLDLYGDITYPDYQKDCLKIAEEYNIRDRVIFHGITTDVPGALAQSSICLFPSKFEGFGMGLGEALAAGLPSIGFRYASGVNELIHDGENGFLVNDVNEMAQKLKQLLQSDKLQEQMSYQAQKYIQEYTPELIWKKWDNLLSEIANKKD